MFESHLAWIEKVRVALDPKLKDQVCQRANQDIARLLPILGFCLRATNVRNAFELFVPLLEIAKQLLKADTKLILSSEWMFSPLTYPLVFPELPDFVLIGLPAPESCNPLVVPLAGHELGHSVWRVHKIEQRLSPLMEAAVIATLKADWANFKRIHSYPGDVTAIQNDLFINSISVSAQKRALAQAQEIFCDSIGIRIFGSSYFYAFEYLLRPSLGNRRSEKYPAIRERADVMLRTAKKFGLPHEANYSTRFTELNLNLGEREAYHLSLSDKSTNAVVDEILGLVETIANDAKLPLPNDPERISDIYNCFRERNPGSDIKSLPDIINAGWKAYLDNDLWRADGYTGDRFGPLSELVLKTIEVMEFEIRMRA